MNGITILALDPSTEITGAVVLRMPDRGDPQLIAWTAKNAMKGIGVRKGSDYAARMSRCLWTRRQLIGFVHRLQQAGHKIDLRVFEMDSGRGFDASEALKMATGLYMALPALEDVRMERVTRQAACITAGCLQLYRESTKNMTPKQRLDKRQRLKNAVRAWAVREFPKQLVPDIDDAISDALAIAMYAGLNWRYKNRLTEEASKQMTMKLRAAPKPRQPKEK